MTDYRKPIAVSASLSLPQPTADKIALQKVAAELWKSTFFPASQKVERNQDLETSGSLTTSFKYFPRLPTELQDKIWAFAAEAVDPVLFASTQFMWRFPRRPTWLDEAEPLPYEIILVPLLPVRMRSIGLFHASRAARRASIARYGDPQQGDIIFSPAVDSVYVPHLHDSSSHDHEESCQMLFGREGDDSFKAEFLWPKSYENESTLTRCPLPGSNGRLSRELYYFDDVDSEEGAIPFTYFYGMSANFQLRVRHVCLQQSIQDIFDSATRIRAPTARGLEATLHRFPAVESVTIYLPVGSMIQQAPPMNNSTGQPPQWWIDLLHHDDPSIELSPDDVPEWWSDYVRTIAGAGRGLRFPPGLKRINFVSYQKPDERPNAKAINFGSA